MVMYLIEPCVQNLYQVRNKMTKSGLILDGFIREIGRRQKSFDVRHKFFWYQPSKINQL